MSKVTVISVVKTGDRNTVILTDGKQTLQVEGVKFEKKFRKDPRYAKQSYVRSMFKGWLWEYAEGEGALTETISVWPTVGLAQNVL